LLVFSKDFGLLCISIQALTGEYLGHGRYDTLTGADDGSGV